MRLLLLFVMGVSALVACQSPLTETERVQLDVLRNVAGSLTDSAPVCVALVDSLTGWGPPTAPWLRDANRLRRTMTLQECPPTYETAIQFTDSAGNPIRRDRPLGYIDPHHIALGPVHFDSLDSARLWVREMQGSAGVEYRCKARREDGHWLPICEVAAHIVS